MDTQRMADATRFHRLAVTLTFDPSADDSERWLACIGFDCYGAGPTADEALDSAVNREALGPEPLYTPDSELDDPRTLGQPPPPREPPASAAVGRGDACRRVFLPYRSGCFRTH